jgi:hypothetical protein
MVPNKSFFSTCGVVFIQQYLTNGTMMPLLVITLDNKNLLALTVETGTSVFLACLSA